MTVHFHGQTDGLESEARARPPVTTCEKHGTQPALCCPDGRLTYVEYEDGPPLPVLEWGWTQRAEQVIGQILVHGHLPDPVMSTDGPVVPLCDCPWCRSLNAPATGDQ